MNIDSNNPEIYIENDSKDKIRSIKLTNSQLQNNRANILIKSNFFKYLSSMGKVMNMASPKINSNSQNRIVGAYYRWEHNGEKCHKGMHVQCNDFNGPRNKSHRYWSYKRHPILALRNFKHSDCYYHSFKYGCEIHANMKCHGLRKHPTNCSSFRGVHHWPKTLWWR